MHVKEGFFGEDDDYENFYDDVDVFESLIQSLRNFNVNDVLHKNEHEVVGSRCSATSEIEGFLANLALRSPSRSEAVAIAESVLRVASDNGQNTQAAPQNQPSNAGHNGSNNGGNINDASRRGVGGGVVGGGGGDGGGGSGVILFVGDLHWWTTDAEVETESSKYGPVKEVIVFGETASGKSNGYCQVEFYDPASASACKDGMNGHFFNGRPCRVAFASPFSVRKMGQAQVRTQQMAQTNTNQGRGWAQGRGGKGGQMRNRGGAVGVQGTMGNGGNAFGQGLGTTPPMMGRGFNPGFGPIRRMGPGMMSGFPPARGVGMPGVAPHVNPAFFQRGMGMNGMGMMPASGMNGPNMGMWSDPSMGGGWPGDEHGGRVGESSEGEDAVSDHQYGESHDRGNRQSGPKEKDRGSASSERRFRDDRKGGYERAAHIEKDGGHDHDWSERGPRDERNIGRDKMVRERSRDRERDRVRRRDRERSSESDDECERGRSSRNHSKSRISHDEERPRFRDADY